MTKNEKFINFLESLKNGENKTLIESVVEGFSCIVEEQGSPAPGSIEAFNKEEISSMGEGAIKRFLDLGKIAFGANQEEAAQKLAGKYGVTPQGVLETPKGIIAFYTGEE